MKRLSRGTGMGAAVVLFLVTSISIASAALTFNGTAISGDSGVMIDSSGTISIGTSFAAGITIGSSNSTVSFPGTVAMGTAVLGSPQFGLGGWTVNSAIHWTNGYPSGGNPQISVTGTLDAADATSGSDIAGGILSWNTTGASSTFGIDGLMLRLMPGFTGNHVTRVIDAQNLIGGARGLDLQDMSGNVGVAAESQGASTGDNIGIYSIAGVATGRNIAGFFRSYQDPTTTSTLGTNIGVLSVAGHYSDTYGLTLPTAPETAGYFSIGIYHDPRPYLATSSALIADNGNMIAPIFIGRVNSVNAFQITSIGGIYDRPSTDSTNLWQVANASGMPFLDLDSTNGRVGIGTTTPATALQVATASSTIRIGASALSGCIEMGNSDGSAGINYITVLNGALTATTTKPSMCQ